MALGPRLDLKAAPSLVMSARMQQAVRLLAVPNSELESFIAEAVAGNPLLEVSSPEEAGGDASAESAGIPESDRAAENVTPSGGIMDLLSWPEPRRGASGAGPAGVPLDEPAPAPTLAEHLTTQIGLANVPPRVAAVARWLVGHLDEAGYLRLDLSEASASLGVALPDLEEGLALVQALDPAGVGAQDLAECLALQAREADRYDPAMASLIARLELLGQGKLAQLKRICGVDDDDFADMLGELRNYDPRPGLRYGGEPVHCIVPDLLVREAGNGWDVALNPATLPRVLVDRDYYRELRGACGDPPARAWLSGKLAEANWLVRALGQRGETLLKVGSEIVRRQEGFFHAGVTRLKPLTLRIVAEAVGLHESTVSRAVSGKYLQYSRGTYELKFFFTAGLGSADEGEVSSEAVKAAIRTLVAAEAGDAVLSDETIAAMLHKRGLEVARRTISKYREELGIASSVERRRRQKVAAGR